MRATPCCPVEDETLAPLVRLCAQSALEGRPLPAHLAAQAHLPALSPADWTLAVETLRKILSCLDGRSAKRWGLTNDEGVRFGRWRRARLEELTR